MRYRPGWYHLESGSGDSNYLQETGDAYGGNPLVHYLVTSPSWVDIDYQKWEVVDTGGGYCALANKALNADGLQETADPYSGNPAIFYAVTTPRPDGGDYANWLITGAGSGYFNLSSKADSANYLQETADPYNGNSAIFYAVTTPTGSAAAYQKWQFLPTS